MEAGGGMGSCEESDEGGVGSSKVIIFEKGNWKGVKVCITQLEEINGERSNC